MTRDKAKEEIIRLVERFRENLDVYKKGTYNETQLRREFVDPFFEALGWDVTNKSGHAEQYKDVVHEDAVRIGVTTKAPDYSFRVGGQRKFFLETKKPAINIKDDVSPAYQIRRYAWNANLRISILTDFEELAVYDCGIKPNPNDKVSMGRVAFYHFEDYVKKFDEIYDTFSKEAVWKGAFDRYAGEGKKGKKGTETVDKEFLKEIERWRELLAKNIAVNNNNLDVYALNFSVQQTIDRIVFLRICEDRGMENYGQLQTLLNGASVYKRLFDVFYKADQKYNSGLFDFSVDKLTHSLSIDDKALKDIIENLYYPKSPYEFAVFDAEILGNVYEQFLGKVIRLTPSHQAKVEEKPEVKKAGGVYYTPKYIVDYIVANTVGKLLGNEGGISPSPFMGEGRGGGEKTSFKMTPKQVEKIKILDPACGSGSFLLGAYRFLLDWHLKWYTENDPIEHAKGKRPAIYKAGHNDWRLTTAEKKKILLNNIYGVDIDRQAVEVTKLSLLLKVLEGENKETLGKSLALFRERALPNLESNVKCGNSLIGPDFYSQMTLGLPDEEARRINVFDWNDDEKGFGGIIKDGGFDCVIGNPPYGAELSPEMSSYLLKKFDLQDYQLDSYMLFIEKSMTLLRKSGSLGMIIPNTWLLNLQSVKIREHLFNQAEIASIVHYRQRVFSKATVDTEIAIFKKETPSNKHQIKIYVVEKDGSRNNYLIPQSRWQIRSGRPVNIFERPELIALSDKLRALPTLDSICSITQGAKPFQVGKGKPKQTRAIVDEKPFVSETRKDSSFRPLLRGSLIQKYANLWNNNYWISFGDWLAEPRYSAQYDAPSKIVIRQTGDSLIATLDSGQFIVRDNLYAMIARDKSFDLSYVLGLLNSRLLNWFYQRIVNPEKGEALAQVKRGHLVQLPVVIPNLASKTDKALHDRIVSLVDAMLELNKKLKDTKTPHDRELIERRINATDSEIDRLVYKLYNLTEEEIKIVEGGG